VVYPRIPFNYPSDASLIVSLIVAKLAPLFNLTVRSTTLTLRVGTLKAIPVNFPYNSGITKPTALAAPVEEGMMFPEAALPPLQSFPPLAGPSTTN
jgi:hypothetical protein